MGWEKKLGWGEVSEIEQGERRRVDDGSCIQCSKRAFFLNVYKFFLQNWHPNYFFKSVLEK